MLGPRLVAESLVDVPDPLATALRRGPAASGAEVARALARSLRPEEDCSVPPPWLLPNQVLGYRRVLAAIRRYNGALLADPVGSGKTYVALAVALAVMGARARQPAACLVPAPLVEQWRTLAARLGVPVVVGSHQRASRGRLPAGDRGLVIIDESHHFRHAHTKRYQHVAPWLVGRPLLLLSATPIVNRLDDLAAQLLLGVRSDALAADGVASFGQLLTEGRSSPSLGRLIFENASAGQRPQRIERVSTPGREERDAMRAQLSDIDSLRLSRQAPIAALIRGVLYGAAASSPAALAAALRRYRALLLHARDAAAAGRQIGRAAIRQFTNNREDQLLWWEMIAETGTPTELELVDLAAIDRLLRTADDTAQLPDRKVDRLRAVLDDGRVTLVFTARRETVEYLRGRLADRLAAWCTGSRAGIGRTAMPRHLVWERFRSGGAPALLSPRLLVTTDVAAEGLDFRRIERVIHYDLPFTPMRLDQREGRALRLGSEHAAVEVVRCVPPPTLECRLGQLAALRRKAGLAAAAGLGPGGHSMWRWRVELAERYEDGAGVRGIARVAAGRAGVLVGYAIGGSAATLLWLDRATGECTDDPTIVSERLDQAAESTVLHAVAPATFRDAVAAIAGSIRRRLAMLAGRRWALAAPEPSARTLAGRLGPSILEAARNRDARRLQELERVLRFLTGGHTAGERMLIEQAAHQSDPEWTTAFRHFPERRPITTELDVDLLGVVVFDPQSRPATVGVADAL